MNLQISDETLNKAVENCFNSLISSPESYNNSIKKLEEEAIGNSYSRTTLGDEINAKVIAKVEQIINDPSFDAYLGKAVAEAIAEREIQKKNK